MSDRIPLTFYEAIYNSTFIYAIKMVYCMNIFGLITSTHFSDLDSDVKKNRCLKRNILKFSITF
jgi:hypothetical protein